MDTGYTWQHPPLDTHGGLLDLWVETLGKKLYVKSILPANAENVNFQLNPEST